MTRELGWGHNVEGPIEDFSGIHGVRKKGVIIVRCVAMFLHQGANPEDRL